MLKFFRLSFVLVATFASILSLKAESKATKLEVDLSTLSTCVERFKRTHSRHPTEAEGHEIFFQRPAIWNDPTKWHPMLPWEA